MMPLSCGAPSERPAYTTMPLTPTDLPTGSAAGLGVGIQPLIDMTRWVEDHAAVPIFSLLMSRHGTLVYELYTPGIKRDDAHYLMSTSKSVTSAVVGAAIDRGFIPGT